MGESRSRREFLAKQAQPEGLSVPSGLRPKTPTRRRCKIPEDLRQEIALRIRGMIFPFQGQLCMWRAVFARDYLAMLGIPSRLAWGGMVYRVGPHPVRDVVAFVSDSDNNGRVREDGLFGHCWVESGNDILDFAVGDWRALEPDGMDAFGPIQWAIEPPEFFWLDKKTTKPIKGQHTPELGQVWYTRWVGPKPDIRDTEADINERQWVKILTPGAAELKGKIAAVQFGGK